MERVLATEPFVDGFGDIILRSSDEVDFHVYRCIVLVASPIFRDMLSLPEYPATNQYEGAKPVIDMQEASSVLDTLLRFCYPVDTPKIIYKHDFENIAAAARKFEMVSLYGRIVDAYIADNKHVPPLEQYVLAHRFKLPQLARDSARKCLDYSLSDIVGQARSVDLTYLSTIEYNRLLQYHREYCKACEGFVDGEDFSWLDSAEEYAFVICECRGGGPEDHEVRLGNGMLIGVVTWRKWWFNHVRRIQEDIAARGPTAVDDIDMSQAAVDVIASGCQTCRDAAIKELYDFGEALRWQVKHQKIMGVLELDF